MTSPMSLYTADSLEPYKMEERDLGPGHSFRMTPAVRKICCCSVTAAAGFVAAYTLVAYAIALIYEVVWVVEAQAGLPVPSAMLMMCYCVVIAATVTLVHGLIAKENKYLLGWLVAVILVLIPECALVFYMSISHWGLQGVYGGAELACYVARLPGIVCGVVLVQSAFALREMRKKHIKKALEVSTVTSEFDASHYAPEVGHAHAFTNEAFLEDNGKPTGSIADLRRHLSVQHLNYGYPILPQPPPAYWQHLADRHYAASMRGYPKLYPGPYGTWIGPRTNPYDFKRRHSIVGAFYDENDGKYDDERLDSKSEVAFPYMDSKGDYRGMDSKSEIGYPYRYETKSEMGYPRNYYERVDRFPPFATEYDPRFFPREKNLEERYEQYPDMMRPQEAYGVNLMRPDGRGFARDRDYYGNGFRNSHNSVGHESDDMTKYKDVAL